MTLRARSVAIITDGSFLNASPAGVGPAMDWIVSQVKYHSGLDPFPFIFDKDIDLEQAVKDLGISYGPILVLDTEQIESVPEDVLLVNQQEIASLTKSSVV